MAKRRYTFAVLLAALALLILPGSAASVLVDMAGHWSSPLVAALEAKGVISGDVSGRFDPEAPLTRAQWAKMLVVSLGAEADAKLLARYNSRYSDISSSHWAKGYVESLAELGITQGYSNGEFIPSGQVTRAQMAVFLIRAAGLGGEARVRAMEPTAFTDDRQIPDWARGAVVMGRMVGLISGYEDGSFRPDQPITRAEGAAALLRFEELRGSAYHLTGTLVKFDPVTREATVRDTLGNERSFTMAPTAVYYHSGIAVTPQRIGRLDQVWVVLDSRRQGVFLEARYADLLAANPVPNGPDLQVTLPDGGLKSLAVQPGALVYLNGRSANLADVAGAQDVYLALDSVTGEIRVIDAVRWTVKGELVGVDHRTNILTVLANEKIYQYSWTRSALVFLDGQPITDVLSLNPGDKVRIAVDASGALTYVQAER